MTVLVNVMVGKPARNVFFGCHPELALDDCPSIAGQRKHQTHLLLRVPGAPIYRTSLFAM
jgi:hypothetical protein